MAESVQERYASAFRAWQDAYGPWGQRVSEDLAALRAMDPSAVTSLRYQHESELLEAVRKAWESLSAREQELSEMAVDVPSLRLGVYAHHGGDQYTVMGLLWHHEVQRPMVKYVSHKRGKEDARPLRSWPSDPDGWNEPVRKDGMWLPRFRLVVAHPPLPNY